MSFVLITVLSQLSFYLDAKNSTARKGSISNDEGPDMRRVFVEAEIFGRPSSEFSHPPVEF